MDNLNINQILGLHLKGYFLLIGNSESAFKGPIKRGLRLVMWGDSNRKATSCSFINDVDIKIGEECEVEVVILSPQSIDKEINIGETYSIGAPGILLGEFKLIEVIGKWIGRVP